MPGSLPSRRTPPPDPTFTLAGPVSALHAAGRPAPDLLDTLDPAAKRVTAYAIAGARRVAVDEQPLLALGGLDVRWEAAFHHAAARLKVAAGSADLVLAAGAPHRDNVPLVCALPFDVLELEVVEIDLLVAVLAELGAGMRLAIDGDPKVVAAAAAAIGTHRVERVLPQRAVPRG